MNDISKISNIFACECGIIVRSMNNNEEVVRQLASFRDERDWSQFHTGKNLAESISIEAAELLEAFQWKEEADLAKIKEELADVLNYCYLLADHYGIDVDEICLAKIEQNRKKYPVSKAKGTAKKYTELK